MDVVVGNSAVNPIFSRADESKAKIMYSTTDDGCVPSSIKQRRRNGPEFFLAVVVQTGGDFMSMRSFFLPLLFMDYFLCSRPYIRQALPPLGHHQAALYEGGNTLASINRVWAPFGLGSSHAKVQLDGRIDPPAVLDSTPSPFAYRAVGTKEHTHIYKVY